MKKKIIYSILSLLLLVALLFFLKKKGVIFKDKGIKVAVAQAAYRNIIQTVSASGRIHPEVEVSISSDVSGEIVSLPVKEGDSVKQGQVVAKIYADIYNSMRGRSAATVNQAKAQLADAEASRGALKASLEQAKADFERSEQLFNEKVISRQQYDQDLSIYQQAQSNYEAAEQKIRSASFAVNAAQADLQQAVDNVNRTTILAPMGGYVTYLPMKKGERVVGTAQMSGTEIMRVADMGIMEVRVDVGENDVTKVFLGDTSLISVDAYLGRDFKGIVTQIASSSQDIASQALNAVASGSATSGVTNYTIRIRILEDSYKDLIDPEHPGHFPFRPGMSAYVTIQTQKLDHILTIPISAVGTRSPLSESDSTSDGDREGSKVIAFVVKEDDTVEQRAIKTGVQDDFNIQILEGLKEGEKVVSAPYNAVSETLEEGNEVDVVSQKELFEEK